MTTLRVVPTTRPLRGSVRVPSDKSLSHRAVLFAAMAEGTSHLTDVLVSADVRATIAAVTALGARVAFEPAAAGAAGLSLTVTGWGAAGPRQPTSVIDCGNSGTTTRLLMGVLAGWPARVTLVGDSSLSGRPMARVATPLRAMGATVELSKGGTLPLTVSGGALRAIHYDSPVASAQVKSAVLLAGLRASGVTSVTEPALSRDHTERMLPAFGVPVIAEGTTASVTGPAVPVATDVRVPGDPSSAAFLVAAATLIGGSEISLREVACNPTRTGYLAVLERMGAVVHRADERLMGAEPVATLAVTAPASLRATVVTAAEVPSLVDEVPILAVVATQAEGVTRFEGVGELRVKESDRLEAVRAGLAALGARVRAGEDWLEIEGPTALVGTALPSLGDHRLAMSWAIAGLIARGDTTIHDFEAVSVSYPGFLEDLGALCGR